MKFRCKRPAASGAPPSAASPRRAPPGPPARRTASPRRARSWPRPAPGCLLRTSTSASDVFMRDPVPVATRSHRRTLVSRNQLHDLDIARNQIREWNPNRRALLLCRTITGSIWGSSKFLLPSRRLEWTQRIPDRFPESPPSGTRPLQERARDSQAPACKFPQKTLEHHENP